MTPIERADHLQQAAAHLRAIAEPIGPLHAYWDWIFDLEQEAARARGGQAEFERADNVVAYRGEPTIPGSSPFAAEVVAIPVADLDAQARSYADRMGENWDDMGQEAREAARRHVRKQMEEG
jgi:hypothetical protein